MSRFGGVLILVFIILCGLKIKKGKGGILMDTTLLSLFIFITTTAVLGGL